MWVVDAGIRASIKDLPVPHESTKVGKLDLAWYQFSGLVHILKTIVKVVSKENFLGTPFLKNEGNILQNSALCLP